MTTTTTTTETTETPVQEPPSAEGAALYRALAVVARFGERMALYKPEFNVDVSELFERYTSETDFDTAMRIFDEGRDLGWATVEAEHDAALLLVPEYLLPAYELRRRAARRNAH